MKALFVTPLPSPFLQQPCQLLSQFTPAIDVRPVFFGDSSHRQTWGQMLWDGFTLTGNSSNRRTQLQQLWQAEKPDFLLLSSYRAKESTAGISLAKRSNTPIFFVFVEPLIPRSTLVTSIKMHVFKRHVRHASGLGVMGVRAHQQYGRLYKGPIIECPYTFDLSQMLAFDRDNDDAARVRFLYSGRLEDFRDPFASVEAFAKVSTIRPGRSQLIISGKGALEKPLRNYIHTLGLDDDVIWSNDFADWHDLRNLYKQADVLLSLGKYNTWSLTIIEALAARMPVVATHTTEAASAQVIHGYNGYLVHHGDTKATVSHMLHYIDNPHLIREHGARGREIAKTSDCIAVAARLHNMLITSARDFNSTAT